MTAYHEAGHALAAWVLPHADRVHKISIVSRGNMGGHTSLLPDEDRYLWTKNQFLDMMVVTMGGRVAERLIFDEITTGASNDLERATKIALGMIKRYGMSEALGPRTFGKREELVFLGRELGEERDYGDKVAEEIDVEVKEMIVVSYHRAEEILTTHKTKLVRLAEYLIINETVSGDNLGAVLGDEDPESGPEVEPGDPAVPPETPPYAPAPSIPSFPQPSPALPTSQSGPSPATQVGDDDG